ncbi:hypothetical protein ATPR_2920 [Acetobacter tropicalis NBRC 101654]|uniref:Uncharacterized protein n=1 Tax=Acetobacter tropicalis NBRC 101654 TaxID=749388 RepID=F7VHS1_9PROT|nr:hypothetical protein ATPR_2920 [Acetobacter tropicalis NBRC 101654]
MTSVQITMQTAIENCPATRAFRNITALRPPDGILVAARIVAG